ncbi:hypothetical protein A2U01_0047524 [Trifolium medium]|uniref:Uncharacterized protein n=1 Tax=Trifolium medium TaxID=97028 RepID=A0A392QQT8_9FABA|nr:hypothetical protein [Trifolium medium]
MRETERERYKPREKVRRAREGVAGRICAGDGGARRICGLAGFVVYDGGSEGGGPVK